jgi:hypothetical protein
VSFRDVTALAAVAYGGLSPFRAEQIGVASVRPEARAAVEAAFAMPPYFSPDPF